MPRVAACEAGLSLAVLALDAVLLRVTCDWLRAVREWTPHHVRALVDLTREPVVLQKRLLRLCQVKLHVGQVCIAADAFEVIYNHLLGHLGDDVGLYALLAAIAVVLALRLCLLNHAFSGEAHFAEE